MKRISSLFCVLVLMLCSFTAGAGNLRGDVNGDNSVTITDVTALIDMLLSGATYSQSADCNLDNSVNISDVTTLIDYLLIGIWPDVWPEYEYVDLGLSSGTLWATMNVGASSPEDYGDYFAWGETEPKENYNWGTYKWYNSDNGMVTKYCIDSSFGVVDNKTELDPEDDAAYVNWGPAWRIPTPEQLEELINNCNTLWTTRNGVTGRLFTGPNGNTMFMPAGGIHLDGYVANSGSIGIYWSRSLDTGNLNSISGLFINSIHRYLTPYSRYYGLSVRAVRAS